MTRQDEVLVFLLNDLRRQKKYLNPSQRPRSSGLVVRHYDGKILSSLRLITLHSCRRLPDVPPGVLSAPVPVSPFPLFGRRSECAVGTYGSKGGTMSEALFFSFSFYQFPRFSSSLLFLLSHRPHTRRLHPRSLPTGCGWRKRRGVGRVDVEVTLQYTLIKISRKVATDLKISTD